MKIASDTNILAFPKSFSIHTKLSFTLFIFNWRLGQRTNCRGVSEATTNELPMIPDTEQREDDTDDMDGSRNCHVCLGEGWVFGDELDDPEMYEPSEAYKCPCCRGSGDAKDCTYW